jgi:hypothetical protein
MHDSLVSLKNTKIQIKLITESVITNKMSYFKYNQFSNKNINFIKKSNITVNIKTKNGLVF